MKEINRQARETASASRTMRGPIVVAVGASGGMSALGAAGALAARDASELLVISVVEPPPINSFETNPSLLFPWLVEQQISERRETVRERIHRLGITHRYGEPEMDVVYGEPAVEIARVARERGARLIVMGIGPQALRHRMLSSGTASATSRRAPCPVLAVAERARDLARVAVVAIDFSPESVHAARMALPLVADGALVHLVHAWQRADADVPSSALATRNDVYASSLPARFARVRSALGFRQSVSFDTIVLEGKPAEMVLAVARAKRADLIVSATHGRSALDRWMLGSTSTALLRGAECSVLLAPEPPAAERLRLSRHMTGTSSARTPAQWDGELQAFVRRNHDRRTALEIDGPSLGAQVQETGYSLVGAAYDPHDHRVALMFGGAKRGAAHLTRSLGNVRSVAVRSDERDQDLALYIESDEGNALLTFLEVTPAVAASDNS